mmetsp:Transcript_13019/g.34741  ORF Transcript_13019/g.34741 Transcript_13019/m.34741 type:complete len:289 (+) Transcript_13019:2-868(+)
MKTGIYQDEELNPLAGCLPSLAQIPVFIALYRALINLAKEDKLEEAFLWIPSLEGPVKEQGMGIGWLTEWVNGAPQYGWHDTLAYLALPVILVIAQSASFTILTPPTEDPNQKRTQDILKFLPLMIGFFSLSTPSGLVVYWVCNSFLTTLQTLIIRQAIGYKPPQTASAVATAASEPLAPGSPGAAPAPKGFGAFKSASAVDLDAWPSAKTEAAASSSAPEAAATVDVTPVTQQENGVGETVHDATAHASDEAAAAAAAEEESRAAAKRKAKAEAAAKGKKRGKKGRK